MSNKTFELRYARMHTRKYLKGKMSPAYDNRDVHDASLNTKYDMTVTMSMVERNTWRLHNVTVPRENVTVIGDLRNGDPYVITDDDFKRFEVHIDMTFVHGDMINFVIPEVNF